MIAAQPVAQMSAILMVSLLMLSGLGCQELVDKYSLREIQPQTPDKMLKKLQAWEQDLAELEDEYQRKLTLVDKMGRLSKKLAVGYTRLARYELAAREYHKAVQYESGQQAGSIDFRRAIRYYEKAFLYAKVDDDLLYQAGLIYGNASRVWGWEKDSLATAKTIFDGLIRKNPANTAALFQRAVLYYKALDEPQAAIEDLREVVRIDPDDAPAYQLLGQIYFSRRRMRTALKFYSKALAIVDDELRAQGVDPDSNGTYRNLESIVKILESGNRAFPIKNP